MNNKPYSMETDQEHQFDTGEVAPNNEPKGNNNMEDNQEPNGEDEQDNEADLTDESLSMDDPENDLDEEEVSRLFPGRETKDANPYDIDSERNTTTDNEGVAYDEEEIKGTPGYGDNKPESGI